jgi:methionyl-tRNA formyltransferase
MEGEKESGVTIMQMAAGLDTGDMLAREVTEITPEMTASELHDILAETGGELLVNTLNKLDTIVPEKQDDSLSTYADKLTKAECALDFTLSAAELHNKIRGLADYPCAFTFYNDVRIKVYRGVIGESAGIQMPCADGVITLTEIQPEGGKRMKAADFLRGLK